MKRFWNSSSSLSHSHKRTRHSPTYSREHARTHSRVRQFVKHFAPIHHCVVRQIIPSVPACACVCVPDKLFHQTIIKNIFPKQSFSVVECGRHAPPQWEVHDQKQYIIFPCLCVFLCVYVCWPAVRMSTCVCVCVRAWRHAYWKLLLMMFRSRNAQAAAKHRLEYVLAGRISVQIPIYIYYTLSIGRCWPDDADDSLHVLMKGNGNLAYNCQTTIPGYSDYSTRWSITYFNAQHIEMSSNKLKQVNSLYHVLAGCQNR